MATLTFLKFDRVIQVDSPQVEVTIQDLINQIRDYEDEIDFMSEPQIANATGKQALGGGVFVGITLELINDWRVQFEARPGPDTISVSVAGGNLVAVNQYSNNPIKPSAFTQVSVARSSSSTINELEIVHLKYLIENLRPHHTGTGNIFYWDPVNGNDANLGDKPTTAVKTFAQAHSLAADNHHDIITCIAGGATPQTVVDEALTITKDYLFVRGPGRDFKIQPTSTTADTITINAIGVEISGMIISTATSGDKNAITTSGNFSFIEGCWIDSTRGHGINISGADRTVVKTCAIENCAGSGTGNGINIGNNTTRTLISECIIDNNVNGIYLSGTGISDNVIENSLIFNHTGYGVTIGSGVLRTTLRGGNTFNKNTSGSTQDLGTDTYIETPAGGASASEIADAVWDEVIGSHVTAGTTGKTLKDAKTKATLASLK